MPNKHDDYFLLDICINLVSHIDPVSYIPHIHLRQRWPLSFRLIGCSSMLRMWLPHYRRNCYAKVPTDIGRIIQMGV